MTEGERYKGEDEHLSEIKRETQRKGKEEERVE